MLGTFLDLVRCPRCQATVDLRETPIVCGACGQTYPRLGEIPILFRDPEAFVSGCWRRLAQLDEDAALTVRVVEQELLAPDLLPLARLRGRRMIETVRGQVADIHAVLQRLLPAPRGARGATGDDVDDDLPSILTHIYNAYRDWGWPREPDGENEHALALLNALRDGHALGRTLVVGAGACRLAYDLHRTDPGAETLVIDVDPLLMAVAQVVIRGGTVALREANAEIDELDRGVKAWTLAAHDGPLHADRFHFLLADGLEPPLESAAFDTIVTPWFIDLVPADLRDFLSVMYRLLKPGGRWLNLGPLRYASSVPVGRRFTREEVFELAGRAGFTMGQWHVESMPYLVSKLSERGKIEWVLACAATKGDAPGERHGVAGGPPSWLLFRHLPVPTFAGQLLVATDIPFAHVLLSAIDGHRTIDDLTAVIAAHANRSGVPAGQIREAVRQCLAAYHPDCRYNSTAD